MADQGRVAHAIMLSEEEGCGALPLSIALAQYMSCQNKKDGDSCGVCPECNKFQKIIHPDMHFAYPVNITSKSGTDKKPVSDNFISIWRDLVISHPYFTEEQLNRELDIEDKVGTISVAESKEILSKMNMRAYEGGNKYMIIWLPERMTQEAANKLLKIIEEPFTGTYFLLVTHAPERVMRTISSRCLNIQLLPIDTSSVTGKVSPYFKITSELLLNAASKDLVSLISQNEIIVALGRERQKEFCRYSESFIRKVLMVKKGIPSLAVIPDEEQSAVQALAMKLPDSFFEKSYCYFEEARNGVESNVNAKMVFLNLINLLFSSI